MNILLSNYTSMYITFNKGKYIGHLQPPIDDIPTNPDLPTIQIITAKIMMAEKSQTRYFQATMS